MQNNTIGQQNKNGTRREQWEQGAGEGDDRMIWNIEKQTMDWNTSTKQAGEDDLEY